MVMFTHFTPSGFKTQLVTAGAHIYYSIDGSEPTEQSALYRTPFSVGSNTTVRARAFKDGWAPSSIAAAEYIFATASEDEFEFPGIAELLPACPNPFNHDTCISFCLSKNTRVSLNVYDLKGRKIRTLADDSYSKGKQSIKWDGKSDDGSHVSCGMYIYKLKGVDFELTRKLTLMR